MLKFLKNHIVFLLSAFLVLYSSPATSQFYYGLQMDFGKNRVQYNDFFWSFYRYEKFDTYYNEFGRELAEFTGYTAQKKITEMEDFFDYTLEKRIIFIIYNKLSDFRQSNIGLIQGNEEYNLGGVTRMIENKVFLFYEGDHRKFEQQIVAAIAETVINEMLYGGYLKDRITTSTVISFPDWFLKGLMSYISSDWDFTIENRIRDGFLRGDYKNLNRLTDEDAVYAGHSFWRFIADRYGKSLIPNIIYLTRIHKNANKGFLYVLGYKIRELSREWEEYYTNHYREEAEGKSQPQGNDIIKKPRARRYYNQLALSPDGNNVAYVSNEMGQIKLWIYNAAEGKSRKILKRDPKLEQINDYSYPVIAWHPSGRILTFIMEEKGGLTLNYYILESRKFEKRNLLYFDKVLDFSYSPDGSLLVFSAVKNGKSDLYVHYISSSTNEQITDDIPDDLHPRFIEGSKQIIFSSNRLTDTLGSVASEPNRIAPFYSLFIYSFQNRSPVLTRLESTGSIDKLYPMEAGKNRFLSLDNETGVYNRYINTFDSVISFIDTTIHYRFLANSVPLTNYRNNVEEQTYLPATGDNTDVMFSGGNSRIFKGVTDVNATLRRDEMKETRYRKKYDRHLFVTDSIEAFKQKIILNHRRFIASLSDALYDSSKMKVRQPVNISNYLFEQEKSYYYARYIKNTVPGLRIDTTVFRLPKIRIYETFFYNNYFANKIDFSFLGASYQAFSGSGSAFYNPGLNMLFKIGTHDLFENYKITGGFRFAGNFDSNEYLLSLENLKNRIDKQLILHRLTFISSTDDAYVKTYTHEAMYSMKYPFSQVSAVKGTLTLRDDNHVFLSTDTKNLYEPEIRRQWGSLKLEWIYDNTRFRTTNIYFGTRFKIFGEFYYQLNRKKSDVFILGADFRHYKQIHRDLIWANRFAASTSFGSNQLIYYLGGVDNWINLFPSKVEQFDQSVNIDYTRNYVFQTLATNMRGFSQNIRNGNNFALINSEIRWPVFRYFANHPIGSAFLNSFQLVAFGDIGTAWTGLSPYSGENVYDKKIIERETITVIVDKGNEPIVAGFGLGARAELAGYFIRADYAWGIENFVILKPVFYLSFSLDF